MYTIYWDSGKEDTFDSLYDVQEACIQALPTLAEDIVDDNDKHYGCAWSVIIEPLEESGWVICKHCPKNIQFEMDKNSFKMHMAAMHRDKL